MEIDVVVLGGGVAGLALALESAKLGAACAVVDQSSKPSFASVRNQGWLHSGALFAHYGASDTARNCQKYGLELQSEVRRHRGSVISTATGVALLNSDAHADNLIASAEACDIEARRLSGEELGPVGVALLKSPYHAAAVEIPDKTVSNFEFLAMLLELGRKAGVRYIAVDEPFERMRLRRTSTDWSIALGAVEFIARNIVIAAGARSARLASHLKFAHIPHQIKNCYVMAFPGMKTERLYISPNIETGNMNVAPFNQGTTVNFGSLDHVISGGGSEASFDNAIIRNAHSLLLENWPQLVRSNPDVISYICQKIDFLDVDVQERRDVYIRQFDDGCYLFYPGKLTLAISGARRLARMLFQYKRGSNLDVEVGRPELSYQHPATMEAARKLRDLWAL